MSDGDMEFDTIENSDITPALEMVNGRYRLPHPETGKIELFTRVSTVAHTLSDEYHLNLWRDRMLAHGLGKRPDLAMLAANLNPDDPKDRYTFLTLVNSARDTAGANAGANRGTALHAYAERMDYGDDLSLEGMSSSVRKRLSAYAQCLRDHGIEHVMDMSERVVFNKQYGLVGRFDRVSASVGWPKQRVFDLKTQKTMDFGGLEIAMQLAIYAHADYMWDEHERKWEEFPKDSVDQSLGIVAHLPSVDQGDSPGEPECTIYSVDLDTGWKAVRLAMQVRAARKIGKGAIAPLANTHELRVAILQATSREELSEIWQQGQTVWDATLSSLGQERLQEIEKGNAE